VGLAAVVILTRQQVYERLQNQFDERAVSTPPCSHCSRICTTEQCILSHECVEQRLLAAGPHPLEVLVAPFIAASQAIPVVAVAPIIILLLRAGLRPKVLIGAVVVFPLLITVVTGLIHV
jgi:hypothetical protein